MADVPAEPKPRAEKVTVSWEPIEEGVDLRIAWVHYKLPMTSVRELRDDMEEANMLARGFEKVETTAAGVLYHDTLIMGSHHFMCRDVLLGGVPGEVVLQFDDDYIELTLPEDRALTVWRPIQ